MSKSIKYKDFIDSSSINHNRKSLKDMLNGNMHIRDLNEIINTGMYFVTPICINRPSELEYGTLIVFHSCTDGTEFIQQLFINNYVVNGKRFAIRSVATENKIYNWNGWTIY